MSLKTKWQQRLALNKVKEENEAFDKRFGKSAQNKIIPALYTGARNDHRVVKEIKGTVTGKTIAYEDENGSYILAGTDYHTHGRTIKSPATEEFEALQALDYPRFNGCTGL